MFQFPEFPAYTYVFSIRFIVLHYEGFPIRISTDQGSFAAPRSFSQLVTSFFGSWCQGIHLMLFFAWTFLFLGSRSSLNCLSFIKQIIDSVINSLVKRFYPFNLNLFPPFGEIVIYPYFWKDLWIWLNLFNKSFCLCPLICSFLTLQIYFIRFSMNVYIHASPSLFSE